MTENVLQIIGIAGNVLLVAAYIPQILKIVKTKKAEDISTLMWLAYFIGDILLLVYSIETDEPIFVMLFTLFTIGNLALFYLSIRYNKAPKVISHKEEKSSAHEAEMESENTNSSQED